MPNEATVEIKAPTCVVKLASAANALTVIVLLSQFLMLRSTTRTTEEAQLDCTQPPAARAVTKIGEDRRARGAFAARVAAEPPQRYTQKSSAVTVYLHG